jgi:D-3-phosphoglycerate dehydrogenase
LTRHVVLATDAVSEEGLRPLLEDERFEVVSIPHSSVPVFATALREAEALIVRSATKVGKELFDDAPRLKVIGRAGVGIDNIDLTEATARGIAVYNAPGGNTVAAAELTVALILSAARYVPEADRSIREGRWDRAQFRGVQLQGRTLGLIGAGRIGGEVSKLCRAFGMTTIGYDPYLTEEQAAQLGIDLVGMEDVLALADVISLHVPLTNDTRGMINGVAFLKMKKHALLVNASRGGVVDEEALAGALSQGVIAGAALDVYETEPIPENSPLLGAPNLVLTPHLGASTTEAQVLVATEVSVAIRVALGDGDVSGAINASEI